MFSASPFSTGKSSLVSWLATSACFPFPCLFHFACTFLSSYFWLPAASLGFTPTFAGAGLANNLAYLLLGSARSAEPTFSGILAAGSNVLCLLAVARQEPSPPYGFLYKFKSITIFPHPTLYFSYFCSSTSKWNSAHTLQCVCEVSGESCHPLGTFFFMALEV